MQLVRYLKNGLRRLKVSEKDKDLQQEFWPPEPTEEDVMSLWDKIAMAISVAVMLGFLGYLMWVN